MRTIKFRAWDGSNMINPFCELDHETKYFWGDDRDDVPIHAVMQYTGMKDIDNNEIFECDIVRVDGQIDDNFIVEWGFHSWVLRHHAEKKLIKTRRSLFKNSKVVGNIYSNPELLLTTK
jgi:hypothetical protein